jgi:alkyl sulfatase BDS1-like metallo-beta-lactamase superfamily hydrolase
MKLGVWLKNQQSAFKAGKLDQARQERLNSLGFELYHLEETWERNFYLLSAYRAREGHADVPKLHEEEGMKLGVWLNSQRSAFKAGKLDQARQKLLNSLGVEWNTLEETWERNFFLLSAYCAREGHADVPHSYKVEGVKIGIWLKTQLSAFKAGKLDQARQERLASIGVLWIVKA